MRSRPPRRPPPRGLRRAGGPSALLPAALLGGALAALASAFAACEGPADTRCVPGSDPSDRGDDCPFGPPGGPARDPETCALVELSGEPCTLSWSEDVYRIFEDPDRGRCTLSGCHGTPEDATRARGVFIPIDSPEAAYEQLTRVRGPGGRPYIAPNDPEAFILCNLEGLPGGGQPMPKPEGRLAEEDLAIVRAWVECGMRPPDAGGEGGFGGAGEGGFGEF